MFTRVLHLLPMKLIMLLFIGFCMCESSFQPAQYLSLYNKTTKHFSGVLGYTSINEWDEKDGFCMVLSDSSSQYDGYAQFSRDDDQVFLHSFDPRIPSVPSFQFDPPLPVGPFSGTVGDQTCLESIETRVDSTKRTHRIKVCYTIESNDRVDVPAGEFQSCIRMRMDYVYIDHPDRPFLEGQYLYWFAKGVGLVRYSLNGQIGELLEF